MKNVMINFGGLRGFYGGSYGDEKTRTKAVDCNEKYSWFEVDVINLDIIYAKI